MKDAGFTSRVVWEQYLSGTKIDLLQVLVGIKRRAIYSHIGKWRKYYHLPRSVTQKDVRKYLEGLKHLTK